MNKIYKNPYYLKHVISALKSFNNHGGATTNELISHLQSKLPRNDVLSMALNVRNALRLGISNGTISINPEKYLLKRASQQKRRSRQKTVYCVSSNSTLSSNQYVKCSNKYKNTSSDSDSISVSSSNTSRSVLHRRVQNRKRKYNKTKPQAPKRKSKSNSKSATPVPAPSPPDAQTKPDGENKTDTQAVKSHMSLRNSSLSKHDISKGKSDVGLVQRRRSSRFSCNSPKYSSEYIN